MNDAVKRHDPGGKSRLALLPGTQSAVTFYGEADEHRILLRRWWRVDGNPGSGPFALWIGMNPSTADGRTDDLTCRKEQVWTRMWGLSHYVKTNVGSYRCTDSTALPDDVDLACEYNLPTILGWAGDERCDRIVLATGVVPDRLVPAFQEIVTALRGKGKPLLSLGTTKTGWPRHTSRISYGTPLVPYTGWPEERRPRRGSAA